ncbi:hypothetical protein AnigIFM60653_002519 [Aspergillus niger]|nr:hypothetical protein AnigIFM60653_002519 [Aspergillus niger]
MLAQRIMGIMTHWREYMLMRGKLSRPSHIYTGEAEGGVLPGIQQGQATLMAASQPATGATALPADQLAKKPYCVFTIGQKQLIILTAAPASSLPVALIEPAMSRSRFDLYGLLR